MTMSEFYDVLYEVSSETRHMILKELRKEKAGITHLSKALGISQAEASRHFRRLAQIGVIEKDPDGLYAVTLYGDLIYRLLEPFSFVSEHYDYFKTHDVSMVPHHFISRMHELERSKANYANRANIMGVQENISRVGSEAEDYVNIIQDEAMTEYIMYNNPESGGSKFFQPTSKPNIRFRVILPDGFDPKNMPDIMRSRYIELIKTENREYRTHPELGVALHSSEKEMPILAFPLSDGNYDYLGFEATDSSSLMWSRDLFDYYWEKASPVYFL